MMVIGAVGPLTLDSTDLLGKRASVKGRDSGIARDSEDTLNFSQRNNVASMNEIYPLEKAQEAYERMLSGKALPRRAQDGRLRRRPAARQERKRQGGSAPMTFASREPALLSLRSLLLDHQGVWITLRKSSGRRNLSAAPKEAFPCSARRRQTSHKNC
jgi:hypothetical protein